MRIMFNGKWLKWSTSVARRFTHKCIIFDECDVTRTTNAAWRAVHFVAWPVSSISFMTCVRHVSTSWNLCDNQEHKNIRCCIAYHYFFGAFCNEFVSFWFNRRERTFFSRWQKSTENRAIMRLHVSSTKIVWVYTGFSERQLRLSPPDSMKASFL